MMHFERYLPRKFISLESTRIEMSFFGMVLLLGPKTVKKYQYSEQLNVCQGRIRTQKINKTKGHPLIYFIQTLR